MVKYFSDNDCNYRILETTATIINMVTDFYDQSFNCKNPAKILQMMVALDIDTNLNDTYCFQWTHLILKMVIINDSDDKYDYQKVRIIQNMIMTPDENDNNCGYESPTFIHTMMVTVTERDSNNSYHLLLLWFFYWQWLLSLR